MTGCFRLASLAQAAGFRVPGSSVEGVGACLKRQDRMAEGERRGGAAAAAYADGATTVTSASSGREQRMVGSPAASSAAPRMLQVQSFIWALRSPR